MGGIRHEAALGRQGASETRQHVIEGSGNLRKFLRRRGNGQPAVERARGDGLRLGRHRRQRPEAVSHDPQSTQAGEDECEREAGQAGLQQALPLLDWFVERRTRGDVVADACRHPRSDGDPPSLPVVRRERLRGVSINRPEELR